MNFLPSLTTRSRLFGRVARGFNLPASLLVVLLQRTPVLRVAATAGELVVASPVGTVLKAMIATAATLGAVDSVAGASTQLQTTSTLPALATVGKPFTMAIYITGTGVSFAQSWDVTNTLPPGVTADGGGGHGGATVQGSLLVINLSTGTLTFSGTPTTAGTYSFTAEGYQFPNRTGPVTPGSSYIIVSPAAATVPVINTQPQSQSAAIGSTISFSVVASGSPTPTYQWSKDGVSIPGAIGTSLSLPNVQLANAGTYTVVATNSAGSVTSTGAVLTVLSSPPGITTQPQSQTDPVGAAAIFTVAATGAPAPTYQWQKNGTNVTGATSNTLVLSVVQLSDAGSYTVVATNANGSVTSNPAVLTVIPAAPAITADPVSHTVAVGSTAVFDVQMVGVSVAYQWLKGGTAIIGATASRLIIANAQPSDAGPYTVSLTNAAGSVTSNPATLGVVTTANPGRLVNLSIRGPSGTGSNVLIMGVVTGGDGTSGNTNLLIRGVGPSIIPAPFNVTDALPDPAIQVSAFPSGTVVASNDNWGSAPALTAAATATGAFPLLPNSLDAALVSAFPRGLYSILVSGNNATTGSVLGEIYDTGYPATYNPAVPRLINISTRTYLSAANTLTAGFVIFGNTAQTVLIRGIGPNKPFADVIGAANVLADPRLDLYHSGTLTLTNDNWGGDPQLTTVGNRVGAQALTDPNSKDAVLLVTLDPGVYSAIDYGVNGASGITLIEVYAVP